MANPAAQPDPNAGTIDVHNPTSQTNVSASSASATFAQMTQVAAYIPPSAWTPQAVLDLHAKQKEVAIRNLDSLDEQRGREFKLAVIMLAGFAAILAVGFYFAYLKIDLGHDIVIAAVSAGLGYAAGYGTGLTKRQQ